MKSILSKLRSCIAQLIDLNYLLNLTFIDLKYVKTFGPPILKDDLLENLNSHETLSHLLLFLSRLITSAFAQSQSSKIPLFIFSFIYSI